MPGPHILKAISMLLEFPFYFCFCVCFPHGVKCSFTMAICRRFKLSFLGFMSVAGQHQPAASDWHRRDMNEGFYTTLQGVILTIL